MAGWVNPRIEGYSTAALEQIYSGANKIYLNNKAFPRAWIVHHVVKVPGGDIQAVKKYLRNPDFNLRTKAVVEDQIDSVEVERYAPNTDAKAEEATIMEYSSGMVLVQAKLDHPGLLVLSDMVYPGWKVYVDGIRHLFCQPT